LVADEITGEITDQSIDGILKSPHKTNGQLDDKEQFSSSSRKNLGINKTHQKEMNSVM